MDHVPHLPRQEAWVGWGPLPVPRAVVPFPPCLVNGMGCIPDPSRQFGRDLNLVRHCGGLLSPSKSEKRPAFKMDMLGEVTGTAFRANANPLSIGIEGLCDAVEATS